MRTVFAVLILFGGIYAAHAFGLGSGNRFGKEGASGAKKAAAATPCNQTGLDFTVNCNMILIPALIH